MGEAFTICRKKLNNGVVIKTILADTPVQVRFIKNVLFSVPLKSKIVIFQDFFQKSTIWRIS
jgi:hypothetical protein